MSERAQQSIIRGLRGLRGFLEKGSNYDNTLRGPDQRNYRRRFRGPSHAWVWVLRSRLPGGDGLELQSRGILFVSQQNLEIEYKGQLLKQKYRPDFLVDNKVIVEIKALACL